MEETSTPNYRKRLIAQLTRGRDCTIKLQNLLRRRIVDGGSVTTEDLVMNILGSFSDSLLTVSSWGAGEYSPTLATTYVGSACSDDRTWESDASEKKPVSVIKDRRGCYKRRKTEDSRVEIADTIEDGFAWRKYGQKEILDAKFPRCYYRCTHKSDGCKALKQVQKLDDGSEMFHITYFGTHTCQNTNKNTQMFSDSEALSVYLLNYEDSKINHSPCSPSTITNVHITPSYSFKQEDVSNSQSDDYLAYDEIFKDGVFIDDIKFH